MITETVAPIQEFEGGPGAIAYACKGHRPVQEFVEELACECDVDAPPERVRHAYYRNVPAGADYPGYMLYIEARGPGRGAYPVTVFDC